MRKKRFGFEFLSYIIAAALVTSGLSFLMPASAYKVVAAEDEQSYAANQWTVLDPATIADKIDASEFLIESPNGVKKTEAGALLPVDGTVGFTFHVPVTGIYSLVLQYQISGDQMLDNTVSIGWNGGKITSALPALWNDVSKDYAKDRFGNEVIPNQKMLDKMHLGYITDNAGIRTSPNSFHLEKGQSKFTLKNNTQSLLLKTAYLVKSKPIQYYSEYSRQNYGKSQGNSLLTIQATDYIAKSDSFIRPANVQNPALSPYDTDERLLNVIESDSWNKSGQKILWKFDVSTPGIYHLAFRYSQDDKQGMPVFRNIEIDGSAPFKEMNDYSFQYTGTGYKDLILSDNNNMQYGIWLDKGEHTISMEADTGPVNEIVDHLKKTILDIDNTGIDIIKLTGGNEDKNRTWNIEQYMPDIVSKLNEWADNLIREYNQLKKISGQDPAFAVNLKIAASNLRDLSSDPDKIPNNLAKLNEGAGSVAELIGDMIQNLSNQPLSVNEIYIFNGKKIPSANAGFFLNLWDSIKRFFSSFSAKTQSYVPTSNNEKALSVWVNRPIQYVELLQQLADSDFTPKTGITVNFSIMPDEQKLILANASKTNPDIAMGIANTTPYQLAIRGALTDLTKYKDFMSYMSQNYNLEELIPYDVENKIYGVTETQDFYVLVYRKDILDKLKLSIPQTWEDVGKMMPVLQRNSMNFYIPMEGWQGLKPLYTTVPFIFQNGGSLYTQDGMKTTINSEKSMNGFKLMTDLFNTYSLAQNVPNFYNDFRYGQIPIGVSNFSTYVMLMNAAPEIAGLWSIAPSPGVKDANGNILRYEVASDRSDIVFSNSKKQNESWKFLKWWLSKATQLKYAYDLETRYGPEYMWNTANLAAFKELPFPQKDKDVILEQWKWIKEYPQNPAGYMVERELSNAWTDVVMNGVSQRIALNNAALISDREIQQKMEEFGYIKNGTCSYKMPDVEELRKMAEEGK